MILAALLLVRPLQADVPVDPGAGEARQWLVRELAKPEYLSAQPTWFDRLSAAFASWLASLAQGDLGAAGLPLLIGLLAIVAGAILAAFLLVGAPRRRRRSSLVTAIFDQTDDRDAAALRRAAETAARSGDWSTAIQELFRAIARSLEERTLVDTSPGTTARGLATRAARHFPSLSEPLRAAASSFDAVRYLGHAGSASAYAQLAALDQALSGARPLAGETATTEPALR
jgi:hypothetical protein